jgi:EAL domain-containing protein (putative c-di-GMP-specific phosphodiesterase class I)/HAMP domain-containing protein
MSLLKQLLVLISVLFLMIFALNFFISVDSIKSYLEGEAQVHAQDTATSLGVSLSPYMVDETDPIIETTMSAIFDMGYYQEIRLENVDKKTLVTLANEPVMEGVPQWFIDWMPMQTAMAQSEISSGWSIAGTVYVTINPGYAYLKLYQQVKKMLTVSLIALVASIGLLLVILRITLSSLKAIDQLALQIAAGRFEVIEKLPWTTEVRNVTLSMNRMSQKIESAIGSLNTKLSSVGKKLNQDDLTGLYKKSSFETDMKSLLHNQDEAYLFLVKTDALKNLVKEFDNTTIDRFLIEFADILKRVMEADTQELLTAYRLFGSEFLLLAKQHNLDAAEKIARQLSLELADLGEKYHLTDIAHIGVTPVSLMNSIESNLLAAQEAYEQACIIGANNYYIRRTENQAKDIAEWKSLVFDVVDHGLYRVTYIGPVYDSKTGEKIMEEAFIHAVDRNDASIAIGTFVSIAEKFAKIIELDKGVLTRVVSQIQKGAGDHRIAVNLSTRTIKNGDFRTWLLNLIHENPALASRLVFSISAYAVAKEVAVFKEFIDFIHQLGAKVMIKRFETQSMVPETVKQLKPDYIRLARDIGNGITVDESKKVFVETMMEIGQLLDIEILAEEVKEEADYAAIRAIGIQGMSR